MKGSALMVEVFQLLMILVWWGGYVWGKECTNIPTELSSHTFRSELLASKNVTRKEDAFSHYHVTPTDDSAWADLLPENESGNEFAWAMAYRQIKHSNNAQLNPPNAAAGGGGGGGGTFLKEVPLHDVRLGSDSLHWRAQQTNLEYLLMLDVDRLVWSFRKTAGLPTLGKPYDGWESPDMELRGHFVGHYLSASAKMWASTHIESLNKKMTALVSALSACQKKIGTGYLSAFPSEQFDRFEAIQPVWAPYYTIHKILAGLLDQYSLAGNAQALNMTKWMVEYFFNRVMNVIAKYTTERHWQSLNEETGGMNDVLYRLYTMTGDEKHLLLAHLFDKPCFLGLLAVKADSLSGFHANTHIPVIIGSQMRYEVTGDPLHKEIATFFMDIVNSSHAYATGGTSVGEFWSNPKRLASTLRTENEESCTTYNMLKVSRHLFTWTKEMAYADYYERALTNGVLGIQRGTEPGKMIYMLPLGRGVSKALSYHGWGSAYASFWCCYGTGIESFSKLGDSIYFEDEGKVPALYVIQYISSSFDWKSARILLNQTVNPVDSSDAYLRVAFTISSKNAQEAGRSSSTLNLRIPHWSSSNGSDAELNGRKLPLQPPGNFNPVSVTQGDRLTLQLPIRLRTEQIKDDRPDYASVQAILFGPYLLAGLTSGDWDIKTGSATTNSPSDWITPIPADHASHLVSFSNRIGDSAFVLTNANQSIAMEKLPAAGTNAAVHATFRLVLLDSKSASSSDDFIGRKVMLEPFDYPGMVVMARGKDGKLTVGNSNGDEGPSAFRLARGLDGKNGTVSLESERRRGCFVMHAGAGSNVMLSCSASAKYKQAASFVLRDGISSYHPMSFVAKGARRNFLLSPLLSLRDESYTVYFNIQA